MLLLFLPLVLVVVEGAPALDHPLLDAAVDDDVDTVASLLQNGASDLGITHSFFYWFCPPPPEALVVHLIIILFLYLYIFVFSFFLEGGGGCILPLLVIRQLL